MGESLTQCEKCDAQNTLNRVPPSINVKGQQKSSSKKQKPGNKVKAYIEETRKEVRREKVKLKNETLDK